jgi:hypothetical protein
MDIYLEAVNDRTGVIVEIGAYRSPVVPRIGEKISLRLTAHIRTPTGEDLPHQTPLLFIVTDVFHNANNTMQTEDWQVPYSDNDNSVAVAVRVVPATTAEGEASRSYIERMALKQEN